MAISISFKARRNGVYYTPIKLADFLVKPILKAADLRIFDPAYGEGALLLAAEKMFGQKKNSRSYTLRLYGCDKAPRNSHLKHLPSRNLLKLDFFEYSLDNKYDVILMNPPFVRHHVIDHRTITECQRIVDNICSTKVTSDLWVYFLVKAVSHLAPGGNLGAILPWSFLQAGYAAGIRKWLAGRFKQIRVLALGEPYFDTAKERIILIWLEGFGQPFRSIEISFSQDLKENLIYRDLNLDSWESENVLYSATHDIEAILREYNENYNFRKFEELADIRIGVVTGADKFFILDVDEGRRHRFFRSHLIPIFTSSRDFCWFSGNGHQPRKRLLAFPILQNNEFRDYIKKGLEEKYHLRSHSLRRKPWYVVKSGETPDAFFPYRASNIPYLVLNDQGAQCTNSIHRIYFKDLSYESRKWVQISLLSVPGQLSLEAYSKTYGRGMLKVEPKALKKALIFEGDGQNVGPVYDKISGLISNNDRIQAMKVATDFIDQRLKIATKLSRIAYSALIELQARRTSKC